MPSITLTNSIVDKTLCPEGRGKLRLHDSKCTGLALEIRPTGNKTYFLRYTNSHGRQSQMKLGRANELSLAQARKLARKHLADIASGEADPLQSKKMLRTVPTLSEFAHEKYLPYVMIHKRSWETDECLLRLHILPRLGNKHLDEVTQEDVISLHHDRAAVSAPGSANRLVIILRYMFNLASRWEIPGPKKNPASGVTLLNEPHRERFLSSDELRRLKDAISESENPMLQQIISMLVLTGARKREVLDCRWEDLDLVRKTWRIPFTKSGKPRTVPLSDSAVELLKKIERQDDAVYVFNNPKTKKPFVSIFYSWDTARKKAGMPDLRIHDLRHSFASFLINAGRSLYEVGHLLGHTQIKTTMRYAHLSDQTLRDAVNVVPLG